MVYINGYLEATTLVRGLDYRLEPPANVMNALDAEAKPPFLPTSKNFLLISHCTKDQLGLLVLRHPAAHVSVHLVSALRIYPLLHFFEGLSKKQQEKALSDNGIGAADLYIRQHEAFDALVTIGLPKLTPMKLKKSHFYVKRTPEVHVNGPNREKVLFILTMPEDGTHCRIGELL